MSTFRKIKLDTYIFFLHKINLSLIEDLNLRQEALKLIKKKKEEETRETTLGFRHNNEITSTLFCPRSFQLMFCKDKWKRISLVPGFHPSCVQIAFPIIRITLKCIVILHFSPFLNLILWISQYY